VGTTTGKENPVVQALTFDCFGTLIDWEGGLKQALVTEGVFEGVKARFDELLRFREKREAEWEALPYRHYREIFAVSLREAFVQHGATMDEPMALRVADSLRKWPPFPDTISALRRLGSHFPLLLLSNVDRAPLAAVVEKLGIPFAELVTAEDVRAYKPAPAHFHEAKRRLGSRAEGWLHVSASSFHDLEPAHALGIACAYVQRTAAKPAETAAPKFVVKDLAELCKKLGV
jgi:2-haloalkanoic acid dehalogenase type II